MDINYKSFVKLADFIVNEENFVNPPNPASYDDILKFSQCERVLVENITIEGGREDCSDAVRGGGYTYRNVRFRPHGKGALTLKGSIEGWALDGCIFDGEGSEYTVEVGQYDNYWTWGRKPTRRGLVVDSKMADGSPIKVRLWDAEKPVVVASNVKIVKVPKIIWLPYFLFRHIWRKLGGN